MAGRLVRPERGWVSAGYVTNTARSLWRSVGVVSAPVIEECILMFVRQSLAGQFRYQ